MDDVAATLSHALGKPVRARCVSPKEAIAAGLLPGWVRSQEWTIAAGYRADIPALARYGVPLTRSRTWRSSTPRRSASTSEAAWPYG